MIREVVEAHAKRFTIHVKASATVTDAVCASAGTKIALKPKRHVKWENVKQVLCQKCAPMDARIGLTAATLVRVTKES